MPDKKLSEISPNIRAYYERARDAVEQKKLDSAITLLHSALSAEPGFFDARKILRAVQRKKNEGSGAGKKALAMFTGLGSQMKGSMAASKNPAEAMAQAEKMLNDDPGSGAGLDMLASNAENGGFLETAAWTYELMREQNPRDISLLRRVATFYMRPEIRDTDKARECYELILKLRPNDMEAVKGIKDAAAVGSIKGGGWEEAKTYRDVMKDQAGAVAIEQSGRVHKSDDIITNQISLIENKLQTEPDNLVHYRRLGELYTQKLDFDKALEYFGVALQKSGGDPSLEASIADTTRRKYDHLIASVQSDYEKTKSDDLKAKLEELENEKVQFQVKECEIRRERYPTDLDIAFEMGQLYIKVNRTDDSIKELQRAQKNPKRRVQALNLTGLCFAKKNILPLAADQFKKGIAEHPAMDGLKKEMFYNLGAVLERQKKEAEAMEQFMKIYEVDIGYRDVSQKVEAYYAKQAAAEAAQNEQPPA